MPELPDVTLYVECLQKRVVPAVLQRIRIGSPFVLRSVEPPLRAVDGATVIAVRRLGKRIVLELSSDLFVVIHLMIAGRLRWRSAGEKLPPKRGLAAFDFSGGTLLFTEEGSKRRASLTVVRGEAALHELNRGGIEVLECDQSTFRAGILRENHTLKRALTDPRLFSGIGNAYSDEILHRARLSPVKTTQRLTDAEVARLFLAVRDTLLDWTQRLRQEVGDNFPEKVTAFRAGFAVHGRYQSPCPDCGTAVARIVYAENETNYCPQCQTGGKLLADRSLSRLLHRDWPATWEELEEMKQEARLP